MTRPSLSLGLAAAALLIASCGGSSDDEKAVKKAVKGVYDALADKDAKRVCDSISKAGKERLSRSTPPRGGKRQSCEQVFRVGLAFAGDALKAARDAEVTDVTVHGGQAKATVRVERRKSDVGLVKQHGEWKLSGLDLTGG